jgi:hypothetical protein
MVGWSTIEKRASCGSVKTGNNTRLNMISIYSCTALRAYVQYLEKKASCGSVKTGILNLLICYGYVQLHSATTCANTHLVTCAKCADTGCYEQCQTGTELFRKEPCT